MFNAELKQIGRINEAVSRLVDVTDTLNDRRCDLDTGLNDFLTDEDMLEPSNLGYVFTNIARNEREVARALNKFDKMLNRVLAERLKLGHFEVTL